MLLFSGIGQAAPVTLKQIHIGFNGPYEPKAEYFKSRQEVRDSWLSSNMTRSKLNTILSKVDFKKQVLLLVAIGDRGRVATGNIITQQIIEGDSIVAYAEVGVSAVNCSDGYDNTFPFTLSVVKKPKGEQFLSGFYIQNFDDTCKK